MTVPTNESGPLPWFVFPRTKQVRSRRLFLLGLATLALMCIAVGSGSGGRATAAMSAAKPCPPTAVNWIEVHGGAGGWMACTISLPAGDPALQIYHIASSRMLSELTGARLVAAADVDVDGTAELVLERRGPPPCPCAKPGADLIGRLATGGFQGPAPVLSAYNLVTGIETPLEDDPWRFRALPAAVLAVEAPKGGVH